MPAAVIRRAAPRRRGRPEFTRRVLFWPLLLALVWTTARPAGAQPRQDAPAPIDLATMRGAYFRHFNAPTFHVHLAEVEVDPDTGRVTILRYVVAQDVGRAINPNGIEGQVQGGVAQGVEYALYENIRIEDGRILESDLESYRLPGALDVPRPKPHPDMLEKCLEHFRTIPTAAVYVGDSETDHQAALGRHAGHTLLERTPDPSAPGCGSQRKTRRSGLYGVRLSSSSYTTGGLRCRFSLYCTPPPHPVMD